MLHERVDHLIDARISELLNAKVALPPIIAHASEMIVHSLLQEGKVISCGNGGSAANATLFTSKMLNRYERERPTFPAICLSSDATTLTAIAEDAGNAEAYSKPIRALGSANDILLAITTSGKSANVIQAVQAAHERDMIIVALTANDGGDVARILNQQDIEIRVNSTNTPITHELHLMIIHTLCDLIDGQLFGME